MIKNLFDIKKQKEKNCTNYILTVKEGKKAKYILIAVSYTHLTLPTTPYV